MENLLKLARIFYGGGVVGLGFQQFMYKDFRPVILPEWPLWMHSTAVWAYAVGIIFIVGGFMIVFDYGSKMVSLFLAGLFFLFFIAFQSAFLLFISKSSPGHLGLWTNPLKELALCGGALLIARTGSESLSRVGSIFFSIIMIVFGIDHFYYTEFVASLVPGWIPGHVFWTYLAGVALIGSGIAIILRIKLRTVALLLASMLFLWLIVLHIPRAIADPNGDKGNEISSVFEALNFTGIAIAIAFMHKNQKAK